MRHGLIISLILSILFVSSSAYGATFKGKVIDADTKEPIEGAVVVATWTEEAPTVAGSTSRLKDVKETLTDKNGEWVIKGSSGKGILAWLRFLTSLYSARPPLFIVFKPGYCSLPEGFGIDSCKEKMRKSFVGIGQGQIVELPKLTKREDRLISLPGTVGFSRDFDKKQLIFLRLINEESKNIFGKGDLDDYIEELEKELANEK